jgi:hypothetical protein
LFCVQNSLRNKYKFCTALLQLLHRIETISRFLPI